MSVRLSVLAAALGFALSASAMPEDLPVFIGDEIVVTATRAPQRLSRSLAAVTVLTRREIESSDAIDLPDLLTGQPSLEISRNGGYGSPTAIRLRGAEGDHTLVLVDGLRMNSISTGTTAIEHLSLDDIERVEIVRGNVSSVYGSEAIGGVVRIFTRHGSGPVRPRLKVGMGTDAFSNIGAGLGGELNPRMSFDFSVGQTRMGGSSTVRKEHIPTPFSFDVIDVDDDESRHTHFKLRFAHRIDERISWGLDAKQSRSDVEYDGVSSNHAKQSLGGYSLFAEGQLLDNWKSRVTLGRGVDNLDADLNGTDAGRYHTRIDQFQWENTFGNDERVLRLGLEAQQQRLESDQVYSKTERRSWGIYAGTAMTFGNQDIDLSLRHDHYSDFGAHVTGRAAFGYQVMPGVKAFAAAATAFKAPTFNDLYLDYPPFYFSNSQLKPERARNVEFGIHYAANGQFVQAAFFVSYTKDMIVIDPVSYDTTVNLDESRNHGLEFAWQGRWMGLNGKAALTLQNPEDAKTEQALLRRSQRHGSFSLSGKSGKFGWLAELVASGLHPDAHITNFTRTSVPGYASINFSGNYVIAHDWKLIGRVLNALDADYSLVHGYATPGRRFQLELVYPSR